MEQQETIKDKRPETREEFEKLIEKRRKQVNLTLTTLEKLQDDLYDLIKEFDKKFNNYAFDIGDTFKMVNTTCGLKSEEPYVIISRTINEKSMPCYTYSPVLKNGSTGKRKWAKTEYEFLRWVDFGYFVMDKPIDPKPLIRKHELNGQNTF